MNNSTSRESAAQSVEHSQSPQRGADENISKDLPSVHDGLHERDTRGESTRGAGTSQMVSGSMSILPMPLLMLLSEWLFAKDLLTLGTVQHSFRDIANSNHLWGKLAAFLWKSALVDGDEAQMARPIEFQTHAQEDAQDDLTAQEICRCMVGVWPSHVDLKQQRRLGADIVGVPQPPSGTEPSTGSRTNSCGLSEKNTGGNGKSRAVDPSNDRVKDSASTPSSSKDLFTQVVFRGPLGLDRAVKANVPFPWSEDFRSFSISLRSCGGRTDSRKVVAHCHNVKGEIRYPLAFLPHVKYGAPFATLWPGHAVNTREATSGQVSNGTGRSTIGKGRDNVGNRIDDANSLASVTTGSDDEGGKDMRDADSNTHERDNGRRDWMPKLNRLPSSGSKPFFYAGFTAYFEITLGEPSKPSVRGAAGGSPAQCVAIGLANDKFPIEGLQPGWDCNSWGFHSDDGYLHHDGRAKTANPTRFGSGDTVGCGLLYPPGGLYYSRNSDGRMDPATMRTRSDGTIDLYMKGAIFFTKNGRYLGIAFTHTNTKVPLYPCVGLDCHCPVQFNFGAEPFAFDLPAFESRALKNTRGTDLMSQGSRNHIRHIYRRRNGFTNPRLLYPYLDITALSKNGSKFESGLRGSESRIIQQSLDFRILSDSEDSSDSEGW